MILPRTHLSIIVIMRIGIAENAKSPENQNTQVILARQESEADLLSGGQLPQKEEINRPPVCSEKGLGGAADMPADFRKRGVDAHHISQDH